jgi:hypothetical protein
VRKNKRPVITEEQWKLYLSLLKVSRCIKVAAERCGFSPSAAYNKSYRDVAFFHEVNKIMNGDYEAQTLPVIITIVKEL